MRFCPYKKYTTQVNCNIKKVGITITTKHTYWGVSNCALKSWGEDFFKERTPTWSPRRILSWCSFAGLLGTSTHRTINPCCYSVYARESFAYTIVFPFSTTQDFKEQFSLDRISISRTVTLKRGVLDRWLVV